MGPYDREHPIGFRVTVDGEPPGQVRGADVDADGSGTLIEQRMYQLIRQPGRLSIAYSRLSSSHRVRTGSRSLSADPTWNFLIDLLAAGGIRPKSVTRIASFDDAPKVLSDHIHGAATKTILVRTR